MSAIKRILSDHIKKRLFKNKAIILLGARQVGKTTMVKEILEGSDKKIIHLNGDDADVRELLSNTNETKLRNIIGSHKILFIDEAQRIENIGLTLKIIVDQIKDVQVVATGSSPLELASKVNEPLTGRKYEYLLFPLSYQEMVSHHGLLEENRMLEERMIYGYYPEIVTRKEDKAELLQLLSDSYLYKDVLYLGEIKKPTLLHKILKALALQVGSEISFNEIAQLVGSGSQTVERYVNLLEKCFVIFQLPAYSKNVRNEIRKGKKIYFYDTGIRNSIIGNYSRIDQRTDVGALWENFMISERMKLLSFNLQKAEMYFWRTTQQQEIDYVEVSEGKITAYEFKWNSKIKSNFSKTFTKAYPYAETRVINKENYSDILLV